ncbi:efflux RND transporter permease subunit [Marinobacter halodurans]|uniref:Efflux RND transporter permease subunit n=1 Tax=Marinobacter halodurans TaxID=2528979 RepID=A0ABY1ZRC8_9GAMM|nr:efflux RND transporter permease subunit [Marinobacter halodurans]TBW57638.1 efflux RND transporter permease subunit [Marinobacter halodurans]
MIERSIALFIDRPAVANLLAILLLAGGLLALHQTRQETLPNVPLERIGVVSELPAASPREVEQRLCYPLETALATVEGVTNIRSESREGLCSITVDVVEGESSSDVRSRMAARVQTLTDLPGDATVPKVEEVVFRNRVARLLVVGDVEPRVLHEVAWRLRGELLAVPEIADVRLEGLPDREISLTVGRDSLYRHDLTLTGIARALENGLGRIPGGLMRGRDREALVSAGHAVTTPDAYADVVIRRTDDGEELRFGDIGRVEDGFGRDAMAAWLDGHRAAALDVYRIGNQDVMDTAEAVHRFVDGAKLPAGISLQLWQDDARQYRDRSGLLWSNALQGLVLLVLLLGLFLGLRLAFWVGAGIPVAMIGACIILPLTGGSLNTISLFAFILVLGIVVDDAVIVGESIEHEARHHGHSTTAVRIGVVRVALPIAVAVLTTALSFVPMLFLPGPEGEFMRVVPIIAITVLGLSLVESLWILPSHLNHAVRRRTGMASGWSQRMNTGFDAAVSRYLGAAVAPMLRWRLPIALVFFGLFLFCASLLHSGWLGVTMFSNVAGDRVMADLRFAEGTSSQQMLEATRALQQSAMTLQEALGDEGRASPITAILAEQGRRDNYSTARDPSAHLRVRVSLALRPGDRDLSPDDIARRWRRVFTAPEGVVSVRFHTSLNRIRPDIHINLYHPDPDTLMTMAGELETALGQLDGVFEIDNNMRSGFTEIGLQVRPGARLGGLTEEELGRQVQAAFQGTQIDRLPQGDHDVPVVLRLPQEQSSSLWQLGQLPVHLEGGAVAPLQVLAELKVHRTSAIIPHYDGKPAATVTAYVDPAVSSPGRVMARLQDDLLGELAHRWPGARWQQAGKPVAINLFLNYLTTSYVLALLAMFFVLTMMFGNYSQPLLIVAAIPFGMVGAILGHALLGLDLTLWSVIGMVAVSGVVINDNLVLIDRINQLRLERTGMRQAIALALAQRIRPILLTTLTTFLAVAPLAFETNPQAGFLVPMAVSLGFGVLFASATTVILVPCLIVLGQDGAVWVRGQWFRLRRATEKDSVEQAYRAGKFARRGGQMAGNPYRDAVLAASWEAGFNDADRSGGSA